ncbi:unnamed protein product [Prunus armeniaca]|uniref:Uncharacterized protein n=1 Tax=Prunus armeniaca TaxID=36596 RepID=A0A6J5XWX2_PRUAR|nr:unnamed protein product [Prunus armeniaca]
MKKCGFFFQLALPNGHEAGKQNLAPPPSLLKQRGLKISSNPASLTNAKTKPSSSAPSGHPCRSAKVGQQLRWGLLPYPQSPYQSPASIFLPAPAHNHYYRIKPRSDHPCRMARVEQMENRDMKLFKD